MKHYSRLMVCSMVLCLPLLLTGCSHCSEIDPQKEMQATFNPLIGKTTEQVVVRLGTPNRIEHVGNLTVYHYHQSYGKRSDTYSNKSIASDYRTVRSWEACDDAEIVFKDGRAISWKGNIQR